MSTRQTCCLTLSIVINMYSSPVPAVSASHCRAIPLRRISSCFVFGKYYREGIYGYIKEYETNNPQKDSGKEFDRVHKILSDEHYDYCFENNAEDILNEKGKAKLKKVKEIVSSFNYDRSDTMVDYYDRGFYDFYNCVAV